MAPTVLAECRPNLRACYFFIKGVPNAGGSSVDVGEKRISVWIPDEQLSISLPPTLTLIPGSISGQSSTESTLTFRTSISGFSTTAGLDDKSPAFSPMFDLNESLSLRCDFCHGNLTDARVFSRVLPLPSSDEPSDFFCHSHSGEPLSLDPKPADFFYNYFFYKVHLDNLAVSPTNSTIECPKCLEPLGEVQGKCAKLWNSVVSFSTAEVKEDSIDKFLRSFAYFIKTLPAQLNKFVLTSSHGSLKHYTLIWIMDRTLLILQNPKEAGCNNVVESEICLEPKKVTKVLYSHHEQLTGTVEEWMKSFNCNLIPIHPKIQARLAEYLKAAADKIPKDCATVDEMGVSYMDR